MSSLSIAHVLGSLGMGGAERVALDLASVQKRQGHTVVVVSFENKGPEGEALADEFEREGLEVVTLPKASGIDLTLGPKVAHRLRQAGVQVVHSHNTPPLVYAAAACRLAGMGVVHTKHGEGHLVSRAGRLLRLVGAPFVNHFVAVSETTRQHARKQRAYPWPDRIHVIENGIRTDVYRPNLEARQRVRSELGIRETSWVVGSIGRHDANKNHRALIEAMLPLLGPNVHVVTAGDGESMAQLKALRDASSYPQSIHLLGRRSDAHEIMAALDVFALPSLSEGLPLVILEALATGVPIVASAVGGIPDVLGHGERGFLVKPGDVEELRQILEDLKDHRVDLRDQNGRDFVERGHSAVSMSDQYMRLYRDCARR